VVVPLAGDLALAIHNPDLAHVATGPPGGVDDRVKELAIPDPDANDFAFEVPTLTVGPFLDPKLEATGGVGDVDRRTD
jgi:hypothetical protein